MKAKLEYIWLDGYTPTQSLRSKTQIRNNFGGTLEECPMWSFDGSSTEQAPGDASDCLLKPVAIFPDPDRSNAYLVMTQMERPTRQMVGRRLMMMTMIFGSDLNKNTSFGMWIRNCHLDFHRAAIRVLRVPTIAQ